MENYYALTETDGIWRPTVPVSHRDAEYSSSGFEVLLRMQKDHFWYRGRHRFLLAALDRHTSRTTLPLTAIDLGGGVGGWIDYLNRHRSSKFSRLALGDSSVTALTMARDVLGDHVQRYQVDLMNLRWRDQWDAAFLLDVIEHIPDHVRALAEAGCALKEGGLLFVTVPALKCFWSYNDEAAHHVRRYSTADFVSIAAQADLELVDCRYFMFLLSPIYWLARKRPGLQSLTMEEKRRKLEHAHRIPPVPINAALSAIFGAETPIGHHVRFPWGTSVLAILRKAHTVHATSTTRSVE